MTFDEALPLVRMICWKWARVYGRLFEIDELVNEIFVSCDFSKFDSMKGQGMGRYIEYRLMDYRRRVLGRPGQKGCALRKQTVHLGYDIEGKFAGFDEIDSQDEWDHLMLKVRPTDQKILRMYYREGLTQQQIGKNLGRSKACISMRLAWILDRLRKKIERAA